MPERKWFNVSHFHYFYKKYEGEREREIERKENGKSLFVCNFLFTILKVHFTDCSNYSDITQNIQHEDQYLQ